MEGVDIVDRLPIPIAVPALIYHGGAQPRGDPREGQGVLRALANLPRAHEKHVRRE